MRVKQLKIERQWWKQNPLLEGKITFENGTGEITVNLDDAKCRAMLEVCADALVAQAQATAAILRDNIIDAAAETKMIGQAA